jgi:tetratricopeptide (TPR) repeat protein
MSLKSIITLFLIALFFNSCNRKIESSTDYFILSKMERDSIAENYNTLSNYFLQPTEMYRIYKDSAIIFAPDNVEYMQKLSYSYKKRGEHIKAMDVLNKAVEIDISNGKVDVLQYRAWSLLYYYRDYEGVISDVNLIEKMTRNDYNSCWGEPCGFHKGQAQYKTGKYNEAIKSLIKVNLEEEKLGFDTNDNYLIFFYIGRCYTELKEYEKAIEYYHRALTSVKTFPETYYQLGMVYNLMNKPIEANLNFRLAEQYLVHKMGEPYVERFDEVYHYMIDRELNETP